MDMGGNSATAHEVAALQQRLAQLEAAVHASRTTLQECTQLILQVAGTSTAAMEQLNKRLRALESRPVMGLDLGTEAPANLQQAVTALWVELEDSRRAGRRVAQLTDALMSRLLAQPPEQAQLS